MNIGVETINEWHKQRNFTPFNEWVYCGYNYVIRRNGIIENARPDYVAGIHCAGHNSESIGICWVGKELLTSFQKISLVHLCKSLLSIYGLTTENIHGHNEFSTKTCPNIDIKELRKLVGDL